MGLDGAGGRTTRRQTVRQTDRQADRQAGEGGAHAGPTQGQLSYDQGLRVSITKSYSKLSSATPGHATPRPSPPDVLSEQYQHHQFTPALSVSPTR